MNEFGRLVTSVAAIILVAICGPLAAQDLEGTLVVANRSGGSISFIDLPTGVELARHPIGPRVPHELAISPNGRIALSSNYGTGNNPGSTVLVFDVPSATLIGEIDLGPNTRPHSLAFLPDGRRAVATMERAGAIALIDVLDRRIIDTFAAGGEDNHMVRVSPDGNTAYAAGRGGAGTLSIIDLTGASDTVVVETGAGAEGLAVSPDGSEVWVANRLANSISVVDTRRGRVSTTIEDQGFVGRVEISAAGRVLIPTGGAPGQSEPQVLSIYDVDSDQLIEQHVAREATDGPGGYSIHIVGEIVFAADRGTNRLLIYDLDDFPSSQVLIEGHDAPDGIAYSPLRMNVLTQ
jgi:YVTN family beta-propeller protein